MNRLVYSQKIVIEKALDGNNSNEGIKKIINTEKITK